jgi:hypothetical protein
MGMRLETARACNTIDPSLYLRFATILSFLVTNERQQISYGRVARLMIAVCLPQPESCKSKQPGVN